MVQLLLVRPFCRGLGNTKATPSDTQVSGLPPASDFFLDLMIIYIYMQRFQSHSIAHSMTVVRSHLQHRQNKELHFDGLESVVVLNKK